MGIYIKLNINPARINNRDWESAYQESLKLLDAYDFLDRISDRKTYKGVDWEYGAKAKERTVSSSEDVIGWNVIGNVKTMERAEDFTLQKDLRMYKQKKPETDSCLKDIYLHQFNFQNCEFEELKNRIPHYPTVFDSKTQGVGYHNYVLAIALLIESRFPKDAFVHGDISKGQVRVAIEWANSILERPIQMPDRTDDHKLLQRLKAELKDECTLLWVFKELTFSENNQEFGEFLRSNFDEKSIKKHYLNSFKSVTLNTVGFSEILLEFLSLGSELQMLCDICVLDEEGCKIPPETFIEYFMSFSFHIPEEEVIKRTKRALQFSSKNPDSETPDTIGSLFGKISMKMAGLNSELMPLIPLEKIKKAFSHSFPSLSNIEEILAKNTVISQKEFTEKEEFMKRLDQVVVKHIQKKEYDINKFEELALWKPGETFSKNIAKGLKQLKEFSEKRLEGEDSEIREKFDALTTELTIETLILMNKYFLIKRETWDFIKENMNNEKILSSFIALLSLNANEINMNKLCSSVINNLELFEYVFFKQ